MKPVNFQLKPGNSGLDCPKNGTKYDNYGNWIECFCDECDFLLCCCPEYKIISWSECKDQTCPRKQK